MAPTPARPAPTLATRALAAPVYVATAGLTGVEPQPGALVVVTGDTGTAVVGLGATGVAVVLQDVEVLVKTGTDTVQGQSVMVKVVAVLTVQVLPKWTISVGPAQ